MTWNRTTSDILRLVAFAAGLAGCASYHELPLAKRTSLATGLGGLDTTLPAHAGRTMRRIDISKPLGLDEVGRLAMLNNPDLKSERGELATARAGVTQAKVLPNPSVGVGYEVLLGGAGDVGAWTASLSQSVNQLVTYRRRVAAANATVAQVDAGQLWREWQVAQKARLLALDIYWEDESTRLDKRELALVNGELATVRQAVEAGNLDLSALAPLESARAGAEQSLATLDLARLKDWQALDAMLGLSPDVRFDIARPDLPATPPNIPALIDTLPRRRPDLVALRLGYRSSDESVRAAILGQYPAFVLGGTWSSDTSNVRSAGPSFTFDLPIFDRNQGQIAQARAQRLLLREQYQARLDGAVGDVHGLAAQERSVAAALVQARAADRTADRLARSAEAAYRQGNLDQRSLADYQTTALQRRLEVVGLERSLGEARITLAVELGLGLPTTRVAVPIAGDVQ